MTTLPIYDQIESLPYLDNAPFDSLAKEINEKSTGKRIIYVPNPGNLGDALIREGTKKFFHDFSIDHLEINIGFRGGRYTLIPFLLNRNNFFVFGGGGSWHRGCAFGLHICKFISKFTRNLIVLPSTFSLNAEGVAGTLFRRANGESLIYAKNSKFCHDMALYLLKENKIPSARKAYKRSVILNAFRTDNESSNEGKTFPENNSDVSLLGDHMSSASTMLDMIDCSDTIRTDRLHVAIAGIILDRNVQLYSGNYPKIADIYEASLKNISGAKLSFLANQSPF